MNNSELVDLLAKHGFESAELSGVDGGSILVMAAGTRVLRLTSKSGKDFLWLHPSLAGEDTEQLFRNRVWRNFGGDRTWIAPESELHIGDLDNPWGTYHMPETVDPGCYTLTCDDASVVMAGCFTANNYRRRTRAELSLEKRISAASNPLRNSPGAADLLGVEYIGYEQATTLKMLSKDDSKARYGIWNLTQIRAIGEILIPVTQIGAIGEVSIPVTVEDQPRDYLAPTGPAHLTIQPGLVRFRIDAAEQHKIGIKAAFCRGRIGFIRKCDNESWSLLVRNFLVNPSAEYIDVPWDDLEDTGYAIQCCNDDGNWGDFGEFEYHTPAIGYNTGQTSYTDLSQLWAFNGKRQQIEQVTKWLLSVDISGDEE
jgi:hypothetical protein